MKVVLGYIAWSKSAQDWHEELISRAQMLGRNIEGFCLTPKKYSPRYSFEKLDKMWRSKHHDLVEMYEKLKKKLSNADVFWNFNGANVHPELFKEFGCLNVYGCFDDPESSAELSKPVAPYADACLIGNLSCGPLYDSWGVKNHAWAPLAFVGDDYNPGLTPEAIFNQDRPIDIAFFGERESPYRRDRLGKLEETFPNAMFRGRGWPSGYVDVEERRLAYSQTKIGWNLHNSVGPVNLRFFSLLANGVLQICDNKFRTGQILELGEEVIGFDSIDECIDLTHYFIRNDNERRRIAANGLKKYKECYTEEKIWDYYFEKFDGWISEIDQIKKNRLTYSGTKRSYYDIGRKTAEKINKKFSALSGYEISISKTKPGKSITCNVPYKENSELGGVNLSEKMKRQSEGLWFEWPNMVALNWACTKLIGDARHILDFGGGTGCFAYEASADPSREIVCVDSDSEVIDWAKKNRSRDNISYKSCDIDVFSEKFDLVVSVDVIEHIKDFSHFLKTCCDLASRAIITTPNKRRDISSDHCGPPCYHQHVREWSAGEFYWILRSFYEEVELYSMPDVYVPEIVPIKISSKLSPLIASCAKPIK